MQEKFKVSVLVTGVKKKCRKTDRHLLNLGYTSYSPDLTEEQIENLKLTAKNSVETNMKSFAGGFTISLNHVIVGEGSETWEPFSDKNKKIVVRS